MTHVKISERFVCGLLLLGILVYAALVRAPYVFTDRLWSDEALYAWYAKRLFGDPAFLLSPEIFEIHPPLFPVLLSLGHGIFPPLQACQMIVYLIGILGIYVIYRLGAKLATPFAGLLSALLLANSGLYLRESVRILSDVAFAVFLTGLVWALLEEEDDRRSWGWAVGLLGSGLILLKSYGILFALLVPLFYGFCVKAGWQEKARRMLIPAACMAVSLAIVVAMNLKGHTSVVTDQGVLAGASWKKVWPYLWYLPRLLEWKYLFFALVWGVASLFLSGRAAAFLLGGWGLCSLAFFSLVPQLTTRYAIVILPCVCLLAAWGVEDALRRVFRHPSALRAAISAVLAGIVVMMLGLTPERTARLADENKYFRNFNEAGHRIKDQARPGTLILCSSERQIRYFSGIEYLQWGGQIQRLPLAYADLRNIFQGHAEGILVQLDNWSSSDASLVDPFDSSQISFFESQGFRVVATFGKMRYHADKGAGALLAPAIWIFE
ncbi:MAG: glycosyltransferase family 39 protein, partial [Candidatus Omnitrophota bacterium]|nr:glycosyltransferase family 39 protein [Candidatus Omnitrophota bacterium]